MRSKLLSLSVCVLALAWGSYNSSAQALPKEKAAAEAAVETAYDTYEAELSASVERAKVDTTAFKTFQATLKANGPSPLYTNPGDAQGILLGVNAIYGQLQAGTFGAIAGQWIATGKALFPIGDPNAPYGTRLNWDSDFAVFNLVNVGPDRKDLVIGWGDNTNDLLKFNFFNTAGAPTTLATLYPTGDLDTTSAIRLGIETGTSQLPIVFGSTGPSVTGGTTNGYIGMITRRLNDTAFGVAGQVLARTDALTLEKDGTNGGLRIGYPTALGLNNVACTGVTAAGSVIGKAFIPTAGVVGGVNQIFTDAQAVVSVHCTFGNAFGLGNITEVSIQRYPGDYYWIGSLTSTYNQ